MSIGDEVRQALKTQGLKQRELAVLLHTTTRSIMRWKKGDSEPNGATLELLRRLVAEPASAPAGKRKKGTAE